MGRPIFGHFDTEPPGVSDDATGGFPVGTNWFDSATKIWYKSVADGTGAAIWKKVTGDQKLNEVLAAGRTTNGTDIELNAGSKIGNVPIPLEVFYAEGVGNGFGGSVDGTNGRWALRTVGSGPQLISITPSSLLLGTNNLTRLTISDVGLISVTSLAPKVVRTAASNNTAAMGLAHKYAVTNTAVARTLTISSDDIANTDREFIIKDESGGAGTKNITVATEGSETIDGQATIDITVDFGVLRLYSDGANLFSW